MDVYGTAGRIRIAACFDGGDSNAAHIVRCVNSHDELLSALRDCIASLGGINSDAVPETARAAIAKATS
jgi:hypothetical protein